jgi:hypothetical protein
MEISADIMARKSIIGQYPRPARDTKIAHTTLAEFDSNANLMTVRGTMKGTLVRGSLRCGNDKGWATSNLQHCTRCIDMIAYIAA